MTTDKTYTINLRKEFLKKPNYKRAKKSITAIREFITRHLKAEEVKIGSHLNKKILERGKTNPPSKITVKTIVLEKIAYVELPEFEFALPKPKEEEKKTVAEKMLGKKQEVKEEHKDHDHAKAEAHQPTKEQEKELTKEFVKEEAVKQKKTHKKEQIEVPSKDIKPQEFQAQEKGRSPKGIVGRTGKKETKEA